MWHKIFAEIFDVSARKGIDEIEFKCIKEKILEYIEPKKWLAIADRTNFLSIKQNEGESYKDFASRLNEATVLCTWEDLKSGNPADEVVKLKFIDGLKDEDMKFKVLEQLQAEIVDFC